MTITMPADPDLVTAAQAGDQRARAQLIAAHLPLVYNVVGRALGGHADVDDVVQETLLCVARDLPTLRDPSRFRPWLVAIAIRQITSHRSRRRRRDAVDAPVDRVDELPGAGVDFEDHTILRLRLAEQRRQVAEAGHWLDAEHRVLLSLWWQEQLGMLSRGEVAAAMGSTTAHAGVRLQRMREQLDAAWTIVAALAARPRCPRLALAAAGWDGDRTSVWRKRFARHVRECPQCLDAVTGRGPLEGLLLGVAPLAVPAGLAAALTAKGLLPGSLGAAGPAAAAASAGLGHGSALGKLTASVAAHPVVSAVAAGALALGVTVTVVTWPEPPAPTATALPSTAATAPAASSAVSPPASPSASARPSRQATAGPPSRSAVATPSAAATLPLGRWSLELAGTPGSFLTSAGDYAALGPVSAASSVQDRRRAAFEVVSGLADAACVTLRAADGRYLRHYELRLRLSPADSTALFREDATFCVRPGTAPGSLELQSHNYPALVIRYRDGSFHIDVSDGSAKFAGESAFVRRAAWGP